MAFRSTWPRLSCLAYSCVADRRSTKADLMKVREAMISSSQACQHVQVGGSLAATQSIDKFPQKHYFWGLSGLFPPVKPSIEVRGDAPQLN